MLGVLRLKGLLDHATGNAALMLFEQGASAAEAAVYLRRWALMTPAQADKKVAFIQAYRGYVFNYRDGYELVRAFVTGGEASWDNQRERYRFLWTSHVTPGLLRHWLEPVSDGSM
jgi:hypothetical protein